MNTQDGIPEIKTDVEKKAREEASSGNEEETSVKFQKLSEAMKHLVSFQKAVDSCNSTFLLRADEMAVVARGLEESKHEVRIRVEDGRIGVNVTGDNVPKFAMEDGEGALVYVNNPIFCDCVIRLGNSDNSFYCHKPYLRRRSKYFEAMLSNFKESGQGDIEIEVLYPEVFESVLEFIYSGKYRDGLEKEWIKTSNLYFWTMWTALYLQIDELITLLMSNFKLEFKENPLFNSQHFPLSILERWIEMYYKIYISRTEKVQNIIPTHYQSYNESDILKLCFIWCTNSQNLPEFATNISHLIKRYRLLNSSNVHLIKHFFSNSSDGSLQERLDPLGLVDFIGDFSNTYYYPRPRFGMNS